ncbi:MAG: NAAT family transporter [Desulfomicrobiaceae bacterium]|nr:NAAT family transporter [Desulfomicrobiaceae bacterium]
MLSLYINLAMQLFFLLTPFFVLSVFLSLTEGMGPAEQRRVALRTTLAVAIIGMTLYWAGNPIFSTLGITLDGFRIGAGSLLFLSSVSLVTGTRARAHSTEGSDMAVVPLAIPITVGPATIGTLLILGAELSGVVPRLVGAAALLSACVGVGIILASSRFIGRVLGPMGLSVMTKITGLVLAAMAAQIVFTGVKNFLS